MSNSLHTHRLQHTRLHCPSLSPGVHSNSCPLSWRCYLTISSSAARFSCGLQSFPASGSFPMMLFTSVGQGIILISYFIVIILLSLYYYCYCCSVAKSSPTLLQPPWTVPFQASLSMKFSRILKNTGVDSHALLQGIPRDQTWVFCIASRFFTI